MDFNFWLKSSLLQKAFQIIKKLNQKIVDKNKNINLNSSPIIHNSIPWDNLNKTILAFNEIATPKNLFCYHKFLRFKQFSPPSHPRSLARFHGMWRLHIKAVCKQTFFYDSLERRRKRNCFQTGTSFWASHSTQL